jgi:sigma-B regulation protein RsbU (phosphoserine phosphatase)
MKNRGIALKLALLILTSITVIFAVVFTYNYFFSRQIISENVEKNARNLAQSTVNRIDTVLMSVEKVPRSLSYFYEDMNSEGEELISLLRSVVDNNPEIYGTTMAFEPYAYQGDRERYAPYVYRGDDGTAISHITYDYIFYDWYQIPCELNMPTWSEPYFDEGAGNIIMVTYSMPFYRNIDGKRVFTGVVTADISLEWLQKII